jgi:hypothetical protein
MVYVGGNSLFAIPYTFATTLVSPTTLSTQSFFVEVFKNGRMSASGF